MLKQREEKCIEREQPAKLAVQKEQEEQAAQSFTPYWNFSMIENEEVLLAREKLMKAIQTFLQKFSRYYFGVMPKGFLEKSSKAITSFIPNEEPKYSLRMGDEHFSTIIETESDELIKSSVENFVPIPSEYEVTFDNESDDDESLSNEDVSMENFKIYSNPLFDDEEISSNKIDLHYFNDESNLIKTLPNQDTLFDSSPKFDYLEEFSGELMPTSIINEERIESDDYDLEGDIHFLEELLGNDSIPLPKNKSSNFDHHDDPSFPSPPPEPPDVDVFFDFEPNSRELISAVMNNIDELNEDKCFDPRGGEIDVFANIKNDDNFPFIFVIRIFLLYLTYPEVSPLLLSTRSKDTIFDPDIST
nr:hypothetical protein [Tanacetum cinerariifolium]